ncbi:keratin, type II cytoskeletal 2 epidermal isoform X1 [Zeugodacus cucurbitae]|uniref:keratin, type II cytoskeletal 2 epidermal isoform X1 n=1 Tax=Zeugodacus cucurbitae TaxID=28588 RepID=UPI0023D8F157|nr:keratin, type II cytoskeletal 2 epidermal isoform X1 [Zeugodacus cucurbitae]
MLEFKKRIHKLATHTLLALVLLQVLIDPTTAATKCHQCTGINCQRTSYAATEDCADALDSCVSVFQGSTVLAQGCFGQLAVELRDKCEMPSAEQTDEAEVVDASDSVPLFNSECHQCSEDLCNNVGSEGTDCIECDSNEDAKCASDTDNLEPQRCAISKAMNTYCYTKIEGNRATRGCAIDLVQQKECLSNNRCSLCSPSDIGGCNRDPKVTTDDSGSDGSSSSGGGGSGSDSGSSSGGSGTGDGGSSSGGANGGSDSGTGSGSGTGDGGSSSGGSSSGGDTGGSNSGTGSGTGDGGSNSGGANGGSDSGDGSSTGGGDSSGSSGNESSNNGSGSGTSNKLFVGVMIMILPYFIQF